MQNRIKILTLTALAALVLKSTNAQEKPESTQIKFNGVSVTPVLLGLETADRDFFPYIINAVGTSFSLANKSRFSPFFGLTTGMAHIWTPNQSKPIRSFKHIASLGVGTQLGKYGVSLDTGISSTKGDLSSMSNLTLSRPICTIGKNISMGAFGGAYVEKFFNNYPLIIGVCGGISLTGKPNCKKR